MNSLARSGGSPMRTPITTRSSGPCSSSFCFRSGNSSRHGTHVGPQKLTTTGRPRRSSRSNGSPSSVVPVIPGAGSPFAIRSDPVVGRVTATMTTTVRVATSAAARATTIGRRGGPATAGPGDSAAAAGAWRSATLGPGGEVPRHQGRMNGALELVGAGFERRHVVDLRCDAREVLPVEDLGPACVEDVDVMWCALVLVVERDLERRAGRSVDGIRVELDALGDDRDPTWRPARARRGLT